MWILWGIIIALFIIVLWFGVKVVIKTKGRYSPLKFWMVMWQVFRIKFFLGPQIKKLKNEGKKIYVTPELICYLVSLLAIRFDALKGFKGIDEALLYMAILDIPKDKRNDFIKLFEYFQNAYNSEKTLTIDYYEYDIENEYAMNRNEVMSFYYLNQKLSRDGNYIKHPHYIVVEPDVIF